MYSIDLSPLDGKPLQNSLRHYANLRCLVWDTFDVLPDAAQEAFPPIALLLDGPKLRPANRLSLVASVMFDMRVVAHHNCPLTSSWGLEFSKVFPGAFHYEKLSLWDEPTWKEFKDWEKEWVKGYELFDTLHNVPGRSLESSSLAMAIVHADLRSVKRLVNLQVGSPRHNPLWLWMKWSWRTRKR